MFVVKIYREHVGYPLGYRTKPCDMKLRLSTKKINYELDSLS